MRRLLAPLAVMGSVCALAACFSSSSGGGAEVDASFDNATPEFDGGPDQGAETGLDATADATMDAQVDTGIYDAPHLDTAIDASVDVSIDVPVDVGMDAPVDTGIDAATEASAPDAADAAPPSCIVAVYGDYAIRSDGTAIFAAGGNHNEVVDANGAPLARMTEIVEQTYSACGLRSSDGTVWCWPQSVNFTNSNGELGNGAFGGAIQETFIATQVVGGVPDGGPAGALSGALHLSPASTMMYAVPTCAILADQTLWCWGVSTAQGNGPDGLFWGTTGSVAAMPYAVAIAAGPAPGDGGPAPLVHASQVAIGNRHACVLYGGQVSCWGDNIAGNLGDNDPMLLYQSYPVPVVAGPYGYPATIDAIGAGYDLTCALSGGSVWCWGSDSWHQIGNPSLPTSFCNLNYCQPAPSPVQVDLPDGGSSQVPEAGTDQYPLTGISQLLVGYQFACGLASTGDLYCWGSKSAGSQYVLEATLYTAMFAPYSGVTMIADNGEDWSGLRYITSAGAYVQGNSPVTPYCQ